MSEVQIQRTEGSKTAKEVKNKKSKKYPEKYPELAKFAEEIGLNHDILLNIIRNHLSD